MPPKTTLMENTEDGRILFSRVVICVQHSEAFGRAYLQIWRTIDTPPRTVNDRRRSVTAGVISARAARVAGPPRLDREGETADSLFIQRLTRALPAAAISLSRST